MSIVVEVIFVWGWPFYGGGHYHLFHYHHTLYHQNHHHHHFYYNPTFSITTSSNIIITNSIPISKPLQRLHPSSRTTTTNITTPTSASTTVANHQNTFSSKLWRNTSPTKILEAKCSTCLKRNSSFKELPQDHFRHPYIFLNAKRTPWI